MVRDQEVGGSNQLALVNDVVFHRNRRPSSVNRMVSRSRLEHIPSATQSIAIEFSVGQALSSSTR